MAKITLTFEDNEDGSIHLSTECDPAVDTKKPISELTGAQRTALEIVLALKDEMEGRAELLEVQ